MKYLLLILLFITSTALAQTTQERLDIISAQVEAIRAEISIDQDPVSNLTAQLISSDRIEIKWTANISGQMDIQYYRPGADKAWQHSVWRYRAAIAIEDQQATVGVGFNVTWLIRAVAGDWVSDPVVVQPFVESSGAASEPNPEIFPDILWGWWYDHGGESRQMSNTLKVFADDIEEALKLDFKVIPFIGEGSRLDHNSSLSEFRQRYENKGRHLRDVTSDNVPVVILGDEPDSYDVSFLEALIELAGEVINPDLNYTFSFRRTHIDPNQRDLPQNTGIIWWNHYPFRSSEYPNPYPHVVSEEEFYQSLERTLKIAREKSAPGTKFMITSQAFSQRARKFEEHGYQFRKPPDEAPLWYAEFIRRNDDMIGALHFTYKKSKYEDAGETMPRYIENVRRVFDLIEN